MKTKFTCLLILYDSHKHILQFSRVLSFNFLFKEKGEEEPTNTNTNKNKNKKENNSH